MSESIKAVVQSTTDCVAAFQELKHRAISSRDIAAAMALRDLAVNATQALHELWFHPDIFNPFDKEKRWGGLAARREMLWFYIGAERDFPILHCWARSRERSAIDAKQKEILAALQFGPGRRKGTSPIAHLLENFVVPVFLEI